MQQITDKKQHGVKNFRAVALGNYNILEQVKILNNLFQTTAIDISITSSLNSDVIQELLNPESFLYTLPVNGILIFLSPFFIEENSSKEFISGLAKAITAAASYINAHFFIAWMPSATEISSSIQCIAQEKLGKLPSSTFIKMNTFNLPTADIFDSHLLSLASIPFTSFYEEQAAYQILREIRRTIDPPFKIIVVDADNTLWRGACAEQTLNEIEILPQHLQLQTFLLEQEKKGFLICIASKNIEADVFNVIDHHPDMLIRRQNIADWEINWNEKSENLCRLAKRLNLSLDTFIFIDDRHEECSHISALLPEVLTILFADTEESIEQINKLWAFDYPESTESTFRTKFYKENAKRLREQEQYKAYSDFLLTLDLQVELIPLESSFISRISELSYRTSQFNCTNKKLSENDLHACLLHHQQAFVISAKDKFGDYGVIGFISVIKKPKKYVVDNFFLSCRSLNKGIEHKVVKKLAMQIASKEEGYSEIYFLFKESERNIPAKKFLDTISGKSMLEEDENLYHVSINLAKNLQFKLIESGPSEEESIKPLPESSRRLISNQALLKISQLQIQQSTKINKAGLASDNLKNYKNVQEKLKRIWRDVFGYEPLTPETSIFSIGASSLNVVRFAAAVNKEFSVQIGIKDIYKDDTLEKITITLQKAKQEDSLSKPSSLDVGNKILASVNQQALFTFNKVTPLYGYNMPSAFLVKGHLDQNCLAQTLTILLKAHPLLNANLLEEDDQLYIKLQDASRFSINFIDMFGATDDAILAFCKKQEKTYFDLSKDALIKVIVISNRPDRHVLFFNVHHIIFDGWSEIIFLEQLSTIYNKVLSNQDIAIADYQDENDYLHFCQLQREWLDSSRASNQLLYWKEKLLGSSYAEIKPDIEAQSDDLFKGSFERFSIESDKFYTLKTLAAKEKTTLFNITLALFNLVISKYLNSEDILIGCPFWNRPFGLFDNSIGYFTNLIPIRVVFEKDTSFKQFIQEVSKTVLDAQLNQDIPFSVIMKNTQKLLSLQDMKGPRILFAFQNEAELSLTGAEVTRFYKGYDFARFNLVFELTESSQHMDGGIYFASHYSADLINGIVDAFKYLLENIEDILDSPLSRISLCSDENVKKIPFLMDPKFTPSDLASLFQQQLVKTPNKIAIIDEHHSLTYEELNRLSNNIAFNLMAAGYKTGDIIGISLKRENPLIIVTLALAKVGITYVALDISHPDDYLDSIVKNSQLNAIISHEYLLQRFSQFATTFSYNQLAQTPSSPQITLPAFIDPYTTLYILYTSGTTGAPKGVMVSHAGFYNVLTALQQAYKFSEKDKMVLFHSFGFDIGQWEIWSALLSGCELFVPTEQAIKSPEAFSYFLLENKITTLNQTPSAFEHLCDAMMYFGKKYIPELRLITFVGEPLNLNIIKKFISFVEGDIEFFDMYGITEVTVYSTLKKIDLTKLDSTINNVGYPIQNTAVLIMDENMHPKPLGAIGEIYLAGYGVAQGYHKNEALTQERFKSIPNSNLMLYKSGDFGRLLENGEIEFYGRVDDQIKLRGHRFELKDIANTINCFEGAQSSAVIIKGIKAAEKKICAFIVPDLENAYPLLKIAQIKNENPHIRFHCLPNKLTVAHSNLFETETLYQELFLNEEYIKNGISINEGDVVFDIGANIGMFSLKVAMSKKDVELFAFEPIPEIFELLKINCEIYDLKNIVTFNLGVYNKHQETEITYYPKASVLSSIHSDAQEEKTVMAAYLGNKYRDSVHKSTVNALIENQLEKKIHRCQLTTISDIIEQYAIQRIDLLKIDAEKSELQVLEGIQQKHWPLVKQIAMEVHDIASNLQSVLTILKREGFSIEIVQNPELHKTGLLMVFAIKGKNNFASEELKLNYRFRWNNEKDFYSALQGFLKSQLPSYMLPAEYSIIPEIPRTVNGKLDKKNLLTHKGFISQNYNTQENFAVLEEKIYQVWCAVLNKNNLGLDDNFFEVGGSSLLLMTVFEKIESMLPGLQITDLFKYPTIRLLAAAFDKAASQVSKPSGAFMQKSEPNDIAIIGYAFKLPSTDKNNFWDDLLQGKNFIKTFTKDELKSNGVLLSKTNNINYVPSCSFVEDIALFDSDFFDIFPVDARLTDPQQRILMELSWEALETSGYVPNKFNGDIGIACGIGTNHYSQNAELETLSLTSKEIFSQKDYLATKIAYKLNLTGPAINVNTACSSGLVNVIQACQSLVLNEADIMLAGGATLILPENLGYIYEEGGIFSKHGICSPFDKKASGTVLGSGAVIFVLKKLSKALQDKDTIHAVIKGYGINNDGQDKVSFSAPSIIGQKKCITKAIKKAKVNPEHIVYIEAHGTGTKMGDAIELRALEEAYEEFTNKKAFCNIGSIKANFGHTDAAAGALGLLKAIMVLKHKTIPPQINCHDPILTNDSKSPFYISTSKRKIDQLNADICAAVSSFGVGGTNAHLIIQEAPTLKSKNKTVLLPNIVILSANSKEALEQQRINLSHLIAGMSEENINDEFLTSLCYTLQCARGDFNYKIAYIVEDSKNIKELLLQPIDLVRQIIIGDNSLLSEKMRISLDLWINSKPVDWSLFYLGQQPQKLHLPTYPFQRKRYWHSNVSLPNNSPNVFAEKKIEQRNTLFKNTELQEAILSIFCSALGYEDIKLNDNFDKLGGDSLVAINILSRIEKEFNCKITIDDIYAAPTIQSTIDKILNSSLPYRTFNHLIRLQNGKDEYPPIFLIHPGNGGVFHYQHFIAELNTKRTIYSVENQIFNDTYRFFNTIEEMAACYIEQIKAAQPKGPYTIIGWSFGGAVAFEMAHQLINAGEQVSHVMLLDTWAKYNELWSNDYFKWVCDHSFGAYDESKKALLLERFYNRKDILVRYSPRPTSVKVILVKALKVDQEFKDVNDPYNYWQDKVLDELYIIQTPSDHLSLINNPYIGDIVNSYEVILSSLEKE
ncbi:MAG: amino acid adenylation protein [Gammaproteobacteria bacterium]|jgi:amino acid adenylation domain-containing protein/FkbH-like protein/FkbM family methyltransferase|nr:amino acid adenylation protein [Gammaproteobacteria bacterium]